MTCPTEESLLLYVENLETSCRAHVESCAACRATVKELEETIGELRSAVPSASNHTAERLLRIEPPAAKASPRWFFFAAAAAILAATGLGLFMSGLKPPVKLPPRQEPAAAPQPVRPEPTPASREMVEGALGWLARNQKPDGSFGSTGLTGLALMAWFGAGHGEGSPEYGRAIQSALASLLANQFPDGRFAADMKMIYSHAICTWALSEAVAIGYSTDPRIRLAASRATEFLVSAQNPGKGWRYSSRCGDNDTSVTFWAGSALTAARKAGFAVPDSAMDGARAWFQEATDSERLWVGYNQKGTGKVFIPGINENYDHHHTMSAGAMAVRLLAGDKRDEPMVVAVGNLATDLPSTRELSRDYYYWHIGTLALLLHDGTDSLTWKDWRGRLLEALRAARQDDGSWAHDRWSKDDMAGPVYATAINAMTLTIGDRYSRK